MKTRALSLVELLVALGVGSILAALLAGAARTVHARASLAVSANNIRQLSAGGAAYLADNGYTFWRYRDVDPDGESGVRWWFGFEPLASFSAPEGARQFDPERGPLAGYVPSAMRPDPSFKLGGTAFKPKYAFGYLGVGYNVLLGGGWLGIDPRVSFWSLPKPGKIVVFATSAQVNTMQRPASPRNPMLEEFYGFDAGGPPWNNPPSIHFRHGGYAMVGFADGSAGFLPIDESTRDTRAPKANVGRFAPAGSTQYLLRNEN